MSEPLPTKEMGMEDWCGSDTDRSSCVILRRVYNGVMVYPHVGQHMVSSDRDTLAFQDTEKLVDWIQQWHRATAVQK